MKTQTLASIFAFSIISTSMIQASTQNNISEVNNDVTVKTTYKDMTTSQIQEVVEKRSITGSLSFALGQELMRRWTEN